MKVRAGLRSSERPFREAERSIGYAAFISYSHAADGQLAPAVQRGLERLAKPWYRRRALRVFRDDSGLAVTSALWPEIATALDKSYYLVLLSSPEAAWSEWVNREVKHWLSVKPAERILLVVTKGELQWDCARGDFDPARSTAVPRALLGKFPQEPRWLDLEWAREETQLDLRHSRFRDAIAQLAAPMHGRPRDDLESEDIHLHRRALHLAWSAVAALLVLVLVAGVGWNNATSNANRADREARIAVARALTTQATANIDQHPVSLLLSLESLRVSPTDEARDTLLRGLLQSRHNSIALNGHTDWVNAVAFSPDSAMVATAGDYTVRRWDAATGAPIGQPLRGHTDSVLSAVGVGPVNDVAFSPDGTMIASASLDSTVRLWEAATGKLIAEPLTHTNFVNAVAFSPDGTLIASASEDDGVRLWNPATGAPIGLSLSHGGLIVVDVAFSPNGAVIASASVDRTVRLWDSATGELIGQLLGHTDTVFGVAFSPDGTMIATAGDNTVRRWDTATGEPIGPPLSHPDAVNEVVFSPDSGTIASASADRTVRLWDAATGEPIGQPLTGHRETVVDVAFSPNGATIASASFDETVRLWDAVTGEPIGQPLSHTDYVNDVAFSPDSTMLASAGEDATVRLWETATAEPIGPPLDTPYSVNEVAFSRDGTTIVSQEFDDTVRHWPVAFDGWIRQACMLAKRNLTQVEWDQFVGPDTAYMRTCPDLPAGYGAPGDALPASYDHLD